jgi:hypothetical protein
LPQFHEDAVGMDFFTDANFWSGFWPAIFGAAAGALIAFALERWYRKRDQISAETAKANRLIATLGRMLATLENLRATLFSDRPLSEGSKLEPLGYGPVFGVPTVVPAIDFGEFDFLLETNDPNDQCAATLGRAHFAHSQFDAAMALFVARNQVARAYKGIRNPSMFMRGEDALSPLVEVTELKKELKYLTDQLAEALPSGIDLFKQVIAELRAALSVRYPDRQFLRLFPENPKLPPVS